MIREFFIQNVTLIAQIIGAGGMCMTIFSYQCREKKNIIKMQLAGGLLFFVSFYLLGAITGACMNLAAVFRAIVYSNREKFRADKIVWVYGFSALYVLVYVLIFTVFKLEPSPRNLAVELLPVAGIIATTIGFSKNEAEAVRKFAYISSPLWLAYNIICFSVGGIVCEVFSLVSTTIAILRFRKMKQRCNVDK